MTQGQTASERWAIALLAEPQKHQLGLLGHGFGVWGDHSSDLDQPACCQVCACPTAPHPHSLAAAQPHSRSTTHCPTVPTLHTGHPSPQVALHFVTTVAFFSWTYKMQIMEHNTSWQLHVFNTLQALWLGISGLQISRGYPGDQWHNISLLAADREYSRVGYCCYVVARVIPFLFEMKAVLQWSCTRTTLNLPHWMKLEDIRNR